MTAKVIPFVPRHALTRKPMLDKLWAEIVEQISVPVKDCGDAFQEFADGIMDRPA